MSGLVEMYLDYCSGMKIRELERKYHLSKASILNKCKQITVQLYTRDGYFVYRNISKIKNDISVAVQILNTCPHCGQEISEESESEEIPSEQN
jgi:transcription initiation factor IIE alpha subunit